MNKSIRKLIPILIILLGFFTFGLSDLIWIYIVSDRVDYQKFLPMKQVSLTVITFGIYGIFWAYKLSSSMHKSNIIKDKKIPLICVILSIISLRNIALFIMYQALENSTEVLKDSEQ